MPKVSIIVPYNNEKYLKRCMENLKSQTYKDYEIILVDDCKHQKGTPQMVPVTVGCRKSSKYGSKNGKGKIHNVCRC